MIYGIYSICDALSGFMTPVLEQNDAVAMRNFRMACDSSKSSSSLMGFRPSDFSLYQIGTFDSQTGAISPLTPLKIVCRGESNGNEETV